MASDDKQPEAAIWPEKVVDGKYARLLER